MEIIDDIDLESLCDHGTTPIAMPKAHVQTFSNQPVRIL